MTVTTFKTLLPRMLLLSLTLLATTAFNCLEEQDAMVDEKWAQDFYQEMGSASMYIKQNMTEKSNIKGFDFYIYKYREDQKVFKIKKASFTELESADRLPRYNVAEKVEIAQLKYLEDQSSGKRRFAEELICVKCLTLQNVIFAVYKVNKEFLPALVQYNKTPEITTYMLNFANRLNVYKLLLEDAQTANNLGYTPCYITPFSVYLVQNGDQYEPVLGETEFFKEGGDQCDHPDTTFSPPEIAFRQRFQKVNASESNIYLLNMCFICVMQHPSESNIEISIFGLTISL